MSIVLHPSQIKVDYKGLTMYVDRTTRFIAIDADGYIHAYSSRPTAAPHLNAWAYATCSCCLGRAEEREDWDETLVEYRFVEDVLISTDYTWCARDSDGTVYAHKEEPATEACDITGDIYWVSPNSEYEYVKGTDDEDNPAKWKIK